ncbi:MAG: hypothetical protein ACLQOO_25390 [Terriglobia bacterium]
MITRRRQPVAKTPVAQARRKPIDFAALDFLRARQAKAETPSFRLARKMRNQKY